jgi:CPA1 family monovalent cation:H+ antiporter
MMLPIILLPDVLNLSIKELEKNSKMFFVLAFIVVILSISVASFISYFLGTIYSLSLGALILLFTILMATDAITVSSIFAKFQLPHKLKSYAEGESLFNDVTALILFYFVAIPLISGEVVSVLEVNLIIFKVIFLSVIVGLICAIIGFIGIKLSSGVIEHFIVIYLVVISSFIIAEHLHIAGILSIVVSVLTFKYLIHRDFEDKKIKMPKNLVHTESKFLKKTLKKFDSLDTFQKKDYRSYKKSSHFIGIFANAFVFIAMISTINLQMLINVKYAILFVFAMTTFVRFVFMSSIFKYQKYPLRWSNTLTLAGAKGGLSVIMAHSIPYDFVYRDVFISIVNGVVLLSIFVYTFILLYYIKINKENFLIDGEIYNDEKQYTDQELLNIDVEQLKKDKLTNAYSTSFIEDIAVKNLKKLQTGHHKISLVILKIENLNHYRRHSDKEIILDKFSQIVQELMTQDCYFGKLENDTYIILMNQVAVNEALDWVKMLETQLYSSFETVDFNMKFNFGITKADASDSYEMLIEKAFDALENEDKFKIET